MVIVVFDGVALYQYFRSSCIIILSGMGDDVPILGAVVTLSEAMVYCCFDDVSIHQYGQIIISLLYLVLESTLGCVKKPKISQITLLFWYVL